MSSITTPTNAGAGLAAKVGEALDELDQRYHPAAGLRKQFNKVFPTHWSFMLGEVALYSFIVLLLSGIYLGLFFDPSMVEVTYDGPFTNLRGVEMSQAYASALHISFDVRGGLFVRQIHHWAALLFVAAMVAHMFRVFFTGGFRKPREANWIIGLLLIFIGTFEGFSGYSLPDDLLSGTGLRIASGITLSVPVIGTWTQWALFGSEFPGNEILPRLYIIHVLILPGILLALIGLHVGLVWYQKHTQFPGAGRTEHNVVGVRILPAFAAKGGAFFAVTVGMLGLLGGLFQINPIWNFGPYDPAYVSAGSQPDFYMAWSDGMARLFPAWEIVLGNYRIPATFWATAVVPAADLRGGGRLPVDRAEDHQGQRPAQPAAAPARRAGAHIARRHGDRVLCRAAGQLGQRLVRVLLLRLAQRDHLDGPHRAAGPPADRLLRGLPGLPRAAALRPGHAGARHRDRHHQAPAARRVHRGAPAAGGRRRRTGTRSRWTTRARRCPGR